MCNVSFVMWRKPFIFSAAQTRINGSVLVHFLSVSFYDDYKAWAIFVDSEMFFHILFHPKTKVYEQKHMKTSNIWNCTILDESFQIHFLAKLFYCIAIPVFDVSPSSCGYWHHKAKHTLLSTRGVLYLTPKNKIG